MSHRRSTVKGSLSFANPTVRAWLFQILAVVAVVGTVLNQTGQAIETIAMTMSVYLIISLTISLLMNIYNRRIAIVER